MDFWVKESYKRVKEVREEKIFEDIIFFINNSIYDEGICDKMS